MNKRKAHNVPPGKPVDIGTLAESMRIRCLERGWSVECEAEGRHSRRLRISGIPENIHNAHEYVMGDIRPISSFDHHDVTLPEGAAIALDWQVWCHALKGAVITLRRRRRVHFIDGSTDTLVHVTLDRVTIGRERVHAEAIFASYIRDAVRPVVTAQSASAVAQLLAETLAKPENRHAIKVAEPGIKKVAALLRFA